MPHIPKTSLSEKRANVDADAEMCCEHKGQPNNGVVRFEVLSKRNKHGKSVSLLTLCKAVEFCAKFDDRAKIRPIFLQRCLRDKILAKRVNRMVVTVSLSWNDAITQSLFPLSLCLAKIDSNDKTEGNSLKESKYKVIRKFTFGVSSKVDENGNSQVKKNFVIPKFAKDAESSKYCALILASVGNPISLSDVKDIRMPWDVASNESRGGEKCLYQDLFLMELCKIWKNMNSNIPLKKKMEITYGHCLLPCIMKYRFQGKSKCISIEDRNDSQNEGDFKKLQISVSTSSL